MHIQLDEAQIIWWCLGASAGAVGMVLSGMWAMLGHLREDVAQQIREANDRIESHMRVEEDRWQKIYDEFNKIESMFVTREVLNLRLGALEANIEMIRKVVDTRRPQRSPGADENSERTL